MLRIVTKENWVAVSCESKEEQREIVKLLQSVNRIRDLDTSKVSKPAKRLKKTSRKRK